eukprot:scaffold327285_cov111-Tisochrysis_lutea.AAC.1
MPAMAKLMLTSGRSIRLTPATSAFAHSCACNARYAECAAARAAEHAVSYETHGPCNPSTKESRPAAIEWLLPVAAYTLRCIGLPLRMSTQSVAAMPRKTPRPLPSKVDRSRPEPQRAA